MNNVDVCALKRIGDIEGDNPEDTALLIGMLGEARKYVQEHSWCPTICEEHFGFGVGGIVGVFLFRFSARIGGTDDKLWVIVGDLPSAYLVTEGIPNARAALEAYCDLMDGWANAVLEGRATVKEFPIEVPATVHNAGMLKTRICFLRENIIPQCA